MKRLTHKARYEAGYKLNVGVKPWEAYDRLGAYEEIGIEPDQIQELKERDAAKAPTEVDEYFGYFECPNCGMAIYASDRLENHKHCLNCGQKLKWEAHE